MMKAPTVSQQQAIAMRAKKNLKNNETIAGPVRKLHHVGV